MERNGKHYFNRNSPVYGGVTFSMPSETKPGQGFRPKEVVTRMIAGAPPPIGREPVYIDPDYGVDPLARFDVPIEEMASIAERARQRIEDYKATRDSLNSKPVNTTPAPPAQATPEITEVPAT